MCDPGPPVVGVGLDLDDTITDWWTGIADAARAAGGLRLVEQVQDAIRAQAWIPRDGIVVNRHHWRLGTEPERFVPAAHLDAFVAALDPPLFEDAADALVALAARFRLALLTNNPDADRVLERHGIARAFDVVVIADPTLRKPDPRAFAPLIDALGGNPVRIAYAGDSITADIEGAQRAGLQPFWVDRWDDGWVPPPGVVRVRSLRELAQVL